jgi:hypothetical protein
MKRIMLLLCVVLSACTAKVKEGDDSNQISPDIVANPATAGEQGEKKLPEFTFPESNFDFGTVAAGEVVSHEFVFTNSGNADLVIAQANGSCGCTVPEFPKDPVPPGKEGKIKVTFNSEGMGGQISKTVTLLANTIPATKVLTISAEVIKK